MRWDYSAMIACIGEGRAPSAAELEKVAERMRREAFREAPVDAGLKRRIVRAALAALGRAQG
jgi:hypothetical protein